MLLSNFELLATAPGGVARLRELILTLAVQGKLVPQDAADEPASVLLQKIAAEKERLIAEGKIKRGKPLPAIDQEEKPFELPQGWERVRLGNVLSLEYGSALPEKERLPGPIPVYGSNGIVGFHTSALVSEPSLIVGRKGSVGAINISLVPFWPIDTSYFVTPPTGIKLHFAFHLLRSLGLAKHDKATAIPGINRNDVYAEIVGLPPLAEQSRIVTRVEELMQLCDALEAKGRLEATQHARLVSTLLATLTDSANADALAENWQRVSAHFDLLLDRPEAVDALEQTILQLAVRGLLVPQDPQDEPASVLLERIRAEKDCLIAEGKIKRDKPLPPIADEERPFDLPKGWKWSTVSEVCSVVTDGEHATPERCEDSSEVPLVTAKNVRSETMDYSVTDYVPRAVAEQCWKRCRPEVGDVLMVSVGATLGRLTVLREAAEMVLVRSVTVLRPVHAGIDVFYFALHLMSPHTQKDIWGSVKQSAQPCLYLAKSAALKIALPPLAEQSRIVARVEHLRRLCADLRQRLATSHSTQARLAEALADTAVSG